MLQGAVSMQIEFDMEVPKFGYWDIRGFGQPIRYLLKYLNINYEEITYKCTLETKFKEWDKVKGQLGLDFPNLPYWIDGNIKLTESRAIIAYLVKNYDPSLLPETDPDINVQIVDGVITEIWSLLVQVTYFNSEETESEYKRSVPMKLQQVSTFMTKFVGPWIFGQKISYLDFLFYEILIHNLTFDPSLLDHLPNLRNLLKSFEEIPAIEKFMRSAEFINAPCFRPWAKVTI